jgi:hypothetical protein
MQCAIFMDMGRFHDNDRFERGFGSNGPFGPGNVSGFSG